MAEWVHYSPPYFDAGQVLVSPVSNPVNSMQALEGQALAVELASTGHLEAKRWTRRLSSLTIHTTLTPADALVLLEDGKVAAALVDTVSARAYVREHPEFVMAEKTTVAEEYVIAARKADFRMSAEIDRALENIAADGTLDELIARWFE